MTFTYRKSVSDTRGFTLIELLIVIAIIGILSVVVMAALGDARVKSRDANRASQSQEIIKALELYYSDNGAYPTANGGFNAYVDLNNSAVETAIVNGGYLPRVPQDPAYDYGGGSESYRYCSMTGHNGNYFVLFVNHESDGLAGDAENTHCYIERGSAQGGCLSEMSGKQACQSVF